MKYIAIILITFLCTACDYIPRKVYEIKTTSGEVIKLYCPSVDKGRNVITYLIDGECILVND